MIKVDTQSADIGQAPEPDVLADPAEEKRFIEWERERTLMGLRELALKMAVEGPRAGNCLHTLKRATIFLSWLETGVIPPDADQA